MPRWLTASVTLFAFLLGTLISSHALAQEPPPPMADDPSSLAKMHFESGKAAFHARDFPSAIREFKQAQALRPSPILDYNIGLANEQLGKPKVAAKYFRRYLEGKPDAPNRAEVEAKIAAAAAAEQQAGGGPPQADEPVTVGPPPPNYQAGVDPYAGQPPPAGPVPYQTRPAKKKSYWWVIFPILGGVTLIALIAFYAYVAAESSRTYYYANGALGGSPGPSSDRDRGVLFRF
ncbi:MAG: tetratricopeptide repeat protein [Myxococcales bacterium]|nr:tetratricopeptide repeat protein [Myxococcales bacterium]